MKRLCKNYKHLYYEIITKPYFGSLKRAIIALEKFDKKPYIIEEFLFFIEKSYPKVFLEIDMIRFYDYIWKDNSRFKNGFQFRLAIVHLKPNAYIRDFLFSEREKITSYTGWYPYIVGSRAEITKPVYKTIMKNNNIRTPRIENLCLGKPLRLTDISNCEDANASLLECQEGSILFDTGFGVEIPEQCNLKAVCISHFHKDHSYGLLQIIKEHKIPVIMSETTLEHIINLNNFSDLEKNAIVKSTITVEEIIYLKEFRNSLDFFPIFHAPGSIGYIYKAFPGHYVYYLGDVCIKNGFLEYGLQLNDLIRKDPAKQKTVIIDAAMIGKKEYSISNEDIPSILIEDLLGSIRKRNIVFISTSIETLIYSYLLSFIETNKSKEKSIKLVLNDSLFNLLKTMWGPLILKKFNIDPFVNRVLGNNRLNFIESQRVYPLSAIDTISFDENVVIFSTMLGVKDCESLSKRLFGADIALVGPWTLKSSIPIELSQVKPRSVIRVSSPDWSFHSTEEDLTNTILEWNSQSIKTVLFHNYPKSLKKYILKFKNNGIHVEHIGKEKIELI